MSSAFTFGKEEHCSGVVAILFFCVVRFLYIWDRNLFKCFINILGHSRNQHLKVILPQGPGGAVGGGKGQFT